MAAQIRYDEFEKLERRLQSFELRLDNLESALGNLRNGRIITRISDTGSSETDQAFTQQGYDEDSGLESRIGRIGLAWLGSVVLLFGIIFLTEYLIKLEKPLLSAITGYLTSGILLLVSRYLKEGNVNLSFILGLNFQVLLYFTTLRLHFLTPGPLVESYVLSLLLLMCVVIFQVYLALRNYSQVTAILGLVFALSTAVMSDSTHFLLLVAFLAASGSVYLYQRYGWSTIAILSIVLVYTVFSLWLLSNPLMMNPMQLRAEHEMGFLYLFGIAGSYSCIPLLRKEDGSNNDFVIGTIIINGFLFTALLALITVRFFPSGYVTLFSLIAVACLAYSILLKSTSDWFFASAFYALYGFMSMSIAIYGLYGFPKVFLLLSVQSLVVVSMALWFRNRLMVIMNSMLFLGILLVYLLSPGSIDGVNFSFALVSLVSARIINWKKSRLQIRTELIRNLYLITGFFMMLHALAHSLPGQFVTLSWVVTALLYFLLSFILKNVKYRYMALGTMISAAFYLFIVDLAKIEVIYRVLAFLSLAVISIGISIYYSSHLKRSGK